MQGKNNIDRRQARPDQEDSLTGESHSESSIIGPWRSVPSVAQVETHDVRKCTGKRVPEGKYNLGRANGVSGYECQREVSTCEFNAGNLRANVGEARRGV